MRLIFHTDEQMPVFHFRLKRALPHVAQLRLATPNVKLQSVPRALKSFLTQRSLAKRAALVGTQAFEHVESVNGSCDRDDCARYDGF